MVAHSGMAHKNHRAFCICKDATCRENRIGTCINSIFAMVLQRSLSDLAFHFHSGNIARQIDVACTRLFHFGILERNTDNFIHRIRANNLLTALGNRRKHIH